MDWRITNLIVENMVKSIDIGLKDGTMKMGDRVPMALYPVMTLEMMPDDLPPPAPDFQELTLTPNWKEDLRKMVSI